jgi:hypothetical protein
MRGLPQTVSALTTASTDDVLAVLFVEADAANVGEMFRRMLLQFELPAVVVFNPTSKTIIGTTETSVSADLVAMFEAATPSGYADFSPAESFKVNTLWNCFSDDIGLQEALANSVQRRTFYGLINTGLAMASANGSLPEPCVIVDQNTSKVTFKFCDFDLSTVVPSGQTVCVKFAPNRTKLIFE